MNKETLRMQMLAGIITEGQYKAKLEESYSKLKFNQVERGRKYFATTNFGIFKKGDEVFVDTVRNLGTEVVLELSNSKGKHDSIKGDLEDEVEVFDNNPSLSENGVSPIIINADDAIELDFSDQDMVTFIFDTPEYDEENKESWADLRDSVSVDISVIQKFLYNQSKDEITIPVFDGMGVMKLDKDYAESIMDSFYGNYPHLDPTNPDYEGPEGPFEFGLNEDN